MSALSKVLDYYEHLERLVTRLPKPLQQPILSELNPVKDIFLRKRPARIAVAGSAEDRHRLVQALFGEPVEALRASGSHLEYTSSSGARLHLMEAPAGRTGAPGMDLWLIAVKSGSEGERLAQEVGETGGVIGVLVTEESIQSAEAERLALDSALRAHPHLRERLAATLAIRMELRFRADGTIDEENDLREGIEELARVITGELPLEAKLEMARLSRVKPVQTELADRVVKSMSVIAGAIGTQPIPFADFPVLTTLQAGMVAAIMYISGRPVNLRAAGEFIAAVGANVGLGLALREGSRAALKFLPGLGHAISGGIAGAGTFAVGRAAMAYFIERRSIEDARRVMRQKRLSR